MGGGAAKLLNLEDRFQKLEDFLRLQAIAYTVKQRKTAIDVVTIQTTNRKYICCME